MLILDEYLKIPKRESDENDEGYLRRSYQRDYLLGSNS
jgi:hypothetical protein